MRYPIAALLAIMGLAGCGTVMPGPRYKVNVDDFAFTGGGTGVVYREDRLRYYPFLLAFRTGHRLYLYDVKTRRHRFIASADAFSVSPSAPLVLCSPPWKWRYRNRGEAPDFYLIDCESGRKTGFVMPPGFDDGYLTYGFAFVEWGAGGRITAFVNFAYCPGGKPASWIWQKAAVPACAVKQWKVVLDASSPAGAAAEAVAWDGKPLPETPWSEIRKRKFISPGGEKRLVFSKYGGHYTFNTTLAIEGGGGGERYIVKESRLVNVVQMGKAIAYYVAAAPIIGLSNLF